jgi:pimeloyl-ACP methyl ester carboxylesterase
VVPGVLRALGEQVTSVVLNAASVPPEGGCGLDCMQPRHREGLLSVLDGADESSTPFTTPGPPADPEAFRTTYGGPPLTDDELAFVTDPARCVFDTVHHYRQPVHWASAPVVPVTYVVTTLDRPVPAALQREMLDRLPRRPTVVDLECGHVPAVVDPEGFAAVLRGVT